MPIWSRFLPQRAAAPERIEPRASVQPAGGGALITTPDQLAQYLQSGATSASGMLVNADTAMRVAANYACIRILAGLPADERDLLLLIAWADLTYAEAGEALGVPLGTVRSRLHRIRRKIRREFGEVDPTRLEEENR